MKILHLFIVLALLLLFSVACSSAPTDPRTVTKAEYLASVTDAMNIYIDQFTNNDPARTVAALSDYTDMTCDMPMMPGLPGTLPMFWSMKMCETLNGPDWMEWQHPTLPFINAQYLYNFITSQFYYSIGCSYMTYMVAQYEDVYGVDIPNVDEVEWPDF